ncbi:putative RND superfamily exporter protein [Okibacterium sp. HSC-33S16]|uniref:phage holin family protein n=1 Tax=Okibacterium sp. HSC-33S16 TaxID=2910965 RepID=UPI0020A0ECE1|nr:phage holin family protein [Okibacterium sp. HSC-33S16]MCP2032993.1 putative RND superfamily exporter protein [Okibacterium sp. HSC-33S16]
MTDPYVPDPNGRSESLGQLLGEVSKDISTLFRQEVELAKAELSQSAKKAGKGAGMFGGAGVAGFLALLFLSIALWWGLGLLMGNVWSAIIVAVIWGIVAGILAMRGRKEVEEINGAPKTAETLKKVPEAFKTSEDQR